MRYSSEDPAVQWRHDVDRFLEHVLHDGFRDVVET